MSAIHKANIQKLGDGMFLSCFRRVAARWRDRGIEAEEVIVDNACMQLVSRPEQFDVVVTPNLYGESLVVVVFLFWGGVGFFRSPRLPALINPSFQKFKKPQTPQATSSPTSWPG